MADQSVWGNQLFECLVGAGVDLISFVPDGGHRVMIQRAYDDPRVTAVPLTTEEEGVAIAAGAHLGGRRAALLMQSSGSGNCINMLSLSANGQFPFLCFVTMRGTFGEQNAWQVPMGRAVRPALESIGVACLEVERPDEVVSTAEAGIAMAYKSNCAVAVLLSQKLIGAKAF